MMENCNCTRSLSAPTEMTKLVIIGAGIAGLGAALKLEQSNFKDYILLEAQSQLGGRIRSIRWGTSYLEMGAQFLHGTESTLGKLIKENDLLGREVLEGQGVYVRENGSAVEKEYVKKANKYIGTILEDCERYSDSEFKATLDPKENIGKILRHKYTRLELSENETKYQKTVKKELLDWNVRFLAIDNACTSLDELSVEKWGDYKIVTGPENSIFKDGYESVVEAIGGHLTKDNVRLDCPVKKIEWDDMVIAKGARPITVTLKSGESIIADCAIVTCSLGYLKENHEKFFSPSLPTRYAKVIESMGFGVINKVFLDFDEPWWEPGAEGWQFLWSVCEESPCKCDYHPSRIPLATWTRDLTGFDVVKTHPNVLVGWVGRSGAKIVETLDEEQIIKDCAKLFRYFLKNDQIPEASKCLRTRWESNEFVRGAYSHLSKKCDASGGPICLSEPVYRNFTFNNGVMKRVPVLMFAGEATNKSSYSTTHGAYDSGIRQAETFLRNYVNDNVQYVV